MSGPDHVYQIRIRTTPERLWAAITDPEETRRYYFGARNTMGGPAGSRWESRVEDGTLFIEGEILESDPPRRLVQTFHYLGDETARTEAATRVSWEIERDGDECVLTLVHHGLEAAPGTRRVVSTGGWTTILARLKEYLEA